MIIWGGYISGGTDLHTGGIYDPNSDSWTGTTTIDAPCGRERHSAIWTGNEMIIWGGEGWLATNCTNQGYLNSGGRYDPEKDIWTETSTTAELMPRSGHTAIWTGNEMIIWGGSIGYSTNTGVRYTPSTDSWISTSTVNASAARGGHTAIWTGSEMIIWGGSNNNTFFNTGAHYNPVIDTWIATSTTNAPAGRYGHTAIWTGSEMIVWGGYDYSVSYNSGGRYDPFTDAWLPTGLNNVPNPYGSAIWTGSEMIVWGGCSANNIYLNTGSKYDLITDSWIPISAANAPEARCRSTAVWTGSEMIVWGGTDYSVSYNSGGRYNPIADSWVLTNTTSAPAARFYHTMVWTGDKAIVWGGTTHNMQYLNTGGIYYPALDEWTDISLINVPTGRWKHTAIWDGNEMIVWGGSASSGYLNTGARFIPDTNLWQPISTTNAPSARISHTAIWTGSEMIIWGGEWLGSGGRYDPFADSWQPTSTVNVPNPPNGHSAVWTGVEMIIWGGTRPIPSGGRYNPATDSWISTNTRNAPTCRTERQAVWTDHEMIMWGGSSNQDYQNTGSRYCALPCSAPVFEGIQSVSAVNTCEFSGIQVTWQQPSSWGVGATSGTFEIRRYSNSSCSSSYAKIATGLSSITTSYIDTSETAGITYYYQVVAINDCTPPNSTAGTVSCSSGIANNGCNPAIPNNTAADIDPCADTGVLIGWAQDPGDWCDGGMGTRTYNVVRDGISISSSLAYGTTLYIDTAGINDVAYTYAVRYNNGCGFAAITPGTQAADYVDTIACPNIGNTLLVAKSGTNAVITWVASSCSDLANYRIFGAAYYSDPFPSVWNVLGNPTTTSLNDPLNSDYVAYKALSVDACGNVSSN